MPGARVSAGRRSGPRPAGPGPALPKPAAATLALQRAAGNAATARLLSRRDAKATTAAPTFKVMIVDPGSSGSQKTRDLDVTTFIVFLVHKGDAKLAVDTGYEYLRLDARNRDAYLQNAKNSLAGEGGYNLQDYRLKRGHPSQSVSFVSVDEAKRMEAAQNFGPESAGRILSEVILHELGHAMGHVDYEDDEASFDHDKGGIMTPSQVIGSAGPYAPAGGFSRRSAEVIRKRLEQVAARAKTP